MQCLESVPPCSSEFKALSRFLREVLAREKRSGRGGIFASQKLKTVVNIYPAS